jgi:CheY-like chemotaxis protein
VLDLQMPVADGLAFLRRLREHEPASTPVAIAGDYLIDDALTNRAFSSQTRAVAAASTAVRRADARRIEGSDGGSTVGVCDRGSDWRRPGKTATKDRKPLRPKDSDRANVTLLLSYMALPRALVDFSSARISRTCL